MQTPGFRNVANAHVIFFIFKSMRTFYIYTYIHTYIHFQCVKIVQYYTLNIISTY